MNSKEFETKIKALAEATGMVHDGGDDTRLFLERDFRVEVAKMTEAEYQKMEVDMDRSTIERESYTVYAWNDAGGYDYWNKEGETNYIQVTVDIKNINKIKLSQLKKDIKKVADKLSKYDMFA